MAELEVQELGYDAHGNLASLRTGDGAVLRLSFDVEQRPVRTVERDGGETRRDYDGADRLAQVIDPLGRRSLFVYGADQRPERIEQPDVNVLSLVTPNDGALVTLFDVFTPGAA
jgi:YD repeat-containing protein